MSDIRNAKTETSHALDERTMVALRAEVNLLLLTPDNNINNSPLPVMPVNGDFAWVNISDDSKIKAPILNQMIKQAHTNANVASTLDTPIPVLLAAVTNDPKIDSPALLHFTLEGKKYKVIAIPSRLDTIVNKEIHPYTPSMLQAVLEHEHEHYHNPPGQLAELESDRAAHNPIDMIDNFLNYLPHHKIPHKSDPHKSDPKKDEENTHPSLSIRIRTLLNEAYGDGVFKKSGQFEYNAHPEKDDARFHFAPKRQDFAYVTEDGRTVANWDAEIAPALKKQVLHDMKKLVSLAADGVTVKERQDSIAYLQHSVSEFEAKHPLKFQPPSNEYLAKKFEESVNPTFQKGAATIESVKTMHPGMPSVYAAWEVINQSADHFHSNAARDQILEAGKQNIIDNIRKGQFPEMECIVDQSSSFTQM